MSGQVLASRFNASFATAMVSESLSVQGSWNIISVLLKTNTYLRPGTEIVLSGFSNTHFTSVNIPSSAVRGDEGFYDAESIILGTNGQFFSNVTWDSVTGTITGKIHSVWTAGSSRLFAFPVLNSQTPNSQKLNILASARCPLHPIVGSNMSACPPGSVVIPPSPVDGGDSILHSDIPADFMVKRIGQSNPYPGETNVITVTLASNFEYRANSGQKLMLTITGLHGIDNHSKPICVKAGVSETYYNQDLSSGDLPFSGACLNCACTTSDCKGVSQVVTLSDPYVSMYVTGDMQAGRQYVFSFEVINPSASQKTPKIQIRLSRNDTTVNQTDMTPDLYGIPTGVVDAQPGDSAPLFIRSSIFSSTYIYQDNANPCANNKICMRIVPS
eukprot:760736-Hanusia_phi.AAC.1